MTPLGSRGGDDERQNRELDCRLKLLAGEPARQPVEFTLEHEQRQRQDGDGHPFEDEPRGGQYPDTVAHQQRDRGRQRQRVGWAVGKQPLDTDQEDLRDHEQPADCQQERSVRGLGGDDREHGTE